MTEIIQRTHDSGAVSFWWMLLISLRFISSSCTPSNDEDDEYKQPTYRTLSQLFPLNYIQDMCCDMCSKMFTETSGLRHQQIVQIALFVLSFRNGQNKNLFPHYIGWWNTLDCNLNYFHVATKMGTGDLVLFSICSGWNVETVTFSANPGIDRTMLETCPAKRSKLVAEVGKKFGRTMYDFWPRFGRVSFWDRSMAKLLKTNS